jgi:methylthioribose-1-phosphate isomerase
VRVGDRWYRTIWLDDDGWSVQTIDQTLLPGRFVTIRLDTLEAVAEAIRAMRVRGAPLIGVAAAHGVAVALRADPSDEGLDRAVSVLGATRPTAANLRWALDQIHGRLARVAVADRPIEARRIAKTLADQDVAACEQIGAAGERLLRDRWREVGGSRPVNILTHCNAGWLATVDWGTALAPVYRAHDGGVPVHVWVDETRPRNQGLLTAWELGQHGVPHTVVVDSAGGHLMRLGKVDLCLVGTDRVAANGDVANKIGTYLKALAARDNGVPFYVAAPESSIDWALPSGDRIPIEERGADELGLPPGVPAANPAFDVTPSRLVTALVTERGVGASSREGLLGLFPERGSGGSEGGGGGETVA